MLRMVSRIQQGVISRRASRSCMLGSGDSREHCDCQVHFLTKLSVIVFMLFVMSVLVEPIYFFLELFWSNSVVKWLASPTAIDPSKCAKHSCATILFLWCIVEWLRLLQHLLLRGSRPSAVYHAKVWPCLPQVRI